MSHFHRSVPLRKLVELKIAEYHNDNVLKFMFQEMGFTVEESGKDVVIPVKNNNSKKKAKNDRSNQMAKKSEEYLATETKGTATAREITQYIRPSGLLAGAKNPEGSVAQVLSKRPEIFELVEVAGDGPNLWQLVDKQTQ